MVDNTNLKVAVYIRLAREDEEIIESQKDEVMQFVEEQGYNKYGNVRIYADNGVSGLDYNRPAFSEMSDAIERGEINTVIVKSIDRIGRDFIATGSWISKVKKKGVAVITMAPGKSLVTPPIGNKGGA